MRSLAERGFSRGELVFVIVVAALGVAGIYALLRPSATPAKRSARKPRYMSMTTPDGLIPIKAVVAAANGADLYSGPSRRLRTGDRLPMFETYYACEKRGDFIRVGNDPSSAATVGWVDRDEVILWVTKEALRPNRANPDRQRIVLWARRDLVGDRRRILYEEDRENDSRRPYPVLAVDRGSYEIALVWQSEDYGKTGVDSAWTQPLTIPDDAQFYYMVTRNQLRQRYEDLDSALIELGSGVNAEHPVVRLLKSHLAIATGDSIDAGDDDAGVIRKALRQLRNPLRITEKQPADVQRESASMRRRLSRLKRFYQHEANWNERGIGWLPAENLPAN